GQSASVGREKAEEPEVGRGLGPRQHGPPEGRKIRAEMRRVVHDATRCSRESALDDAVTFPFRKELAAGDQGIHAVVRERHGTDPGDGQYRRTPPCAAEECACAEQHCGHRYWRYPCARI